MRILAIETSCDDTAIALVEASGGLSSPTFKVLKNIVSSQIDVHRPWGGVVPNLAKREHIQNLPEIFRQIFNLQFSNNNFQINSKSKIPKIDAVAVTVGPGLEPALWAGITFAKQVWQNLKSQNSNLKIIGVNHLEGHLYSFLLSGKTEFPISHFQFSNKKRINKQTLKLKNIFPAIALIVSGGHTILLRMDSLTKWKKLGETRDDAVGESFDKVAKMLGLPYPGGPEIQRLAEKGDPRAIPFPSPMIGTKDYHFSYSGLKTSVLYYLRDHHLTAKNEKLKNDIAASFQEAALRVLIKKTERAVREFNAKTILLSGGVAANKELRRKLSDVSRELDINFIAPPQNFNTDNAAMIAGAGYISFLQKKNRRITAHANLSL